MADLDQVVFMDYKLSQVIGGALLAYSWKKYMEHKNNNSPGFKQQGGYKNLTPFKHDVLKTLTVDLLPLLLFSASANTLLDTSSGNFLQSIYGRILVTFISFLVYYHLIEPYFANKFRKF